MERPPPLAVAARLRVDRFPDARAVLLAGSFVRGEATRTSDLDVVVLYERVERARRSSFMYEGYPVEAFEHDPETLRAFQRDDARAGRPCMSQMVHEGIPVPESSPWVDELKREAAALLAAGPRELGAEELALRRYGITDLIDDLRGAPSREERVAIATALYPALADLYFRADRRWSAAAKTIPRRMAAMGTPQAVAFVEAFAALFTVDEPELVIRWAEELLRPHGGFLFEGFVREAPPDKR